MEQIFLAYGLPKEMFTAIMMLLSRYAHQMMTQTSSTLLQEFCNEIY